MTSRARPTPRRGRTPAPRPAVASAPLGVALAAAITSAGCAPSLEQLVTGHRLDEAVCAVSRFGERDQAQELLATLRKKFDVAIHLEALAPERLEPVAPEAAVGLRSRAMLVRLRTDTRYALGRLAPKLSILTTRAATAAATHPVSMSSLAWVTDEQLPGARTEHYGPSGLQQAADAVQATGAAASVLMNVFTLGIWSLTPFNVAAPPGRPSGTATIEPTDEQIAQAAPAAHAVLTWLGAMDSDTAVGSRGATIDGSGVALRPGKIETFYAVWEFGSDAEAPASALLLTIAYESSCPLGPCTMVESLRIPLAASPSGRAQLDELFGGRMRRLSELRALPGARALLAIPGSKPIKL